MFGSRPGRTVLGLFCLRYGGAFSLPLVMAAIALLFLAITVVIVAGHGVGGWFGLAPSVGAQIYAFAVLADFLALWLLLGPVFAFLTGGQANNLDIIRGFYTAETLAQYFEKFWSGRDGIADLLARWQARQPAQLQALADELDETFQRIVSEDFGGGIYMVPAIVVAAIGAVVLFFGFAGGISLAVYLADSTVPAPVKPLGLSFDLASIAAIFGAYTWVASDSLTRAHQRTFHAADLGWYALRLLIAVPLGQAIAAAAPGGSGQAQGTGALFAFVISMFSLDGIRKFLTAALVRMGATNSTTPEERDDVVIKLAGVDEVAAQALRAEGIDTIAELTAVDPVRTSIITGLPFEYVLRLIDAAILWTFFGTKSGQLREFGFRGASGFLIYVELMAQGDLVRAAGVLVTADAAVAGAADRAAAATAVEQAAMELRAEAAKDALFEAMAQKVGLSVAGLLNIMEQIRRDSYARFVRGLLE